MASVRMKTVNSGLDSQSLRGMLCHSFVNDVTEQLTDQNKSEKSLSDGGCKVSTLTNYGPVDETFQTVWFYGKECQGKDVNVNHIKRAQLLPNNVPCKQHNTIKRNVSETDLQ